MSNSFLQLLISTYAELKQNYQSQRPGFQRVSILNYKEKRSEKTRSKSRNKSSNRLKVMGKDVKKSFRLNRDQGKIEEFIELDKQPLWHPKKRNPQAKKLKQRKVEIKQCTVLPKKIKSTDPLYQFYSQPAENSLNKQLPFAETHESRPQQQQQPPPPPTIIPQREPTLTKDTQINEQQLQNWHPSKQQISMLAIQNLIDEYIIFKNTLRAHTRQTRFVELAKYIREIKGYYFNINVMNEMIEINPKLYRLVNIDGDKYLKCGNLTMTCIQHRQLETKIRMYRRQIENMENQ